MNEEEKKVDEVTEEVLETVSEEEQALTAARALSQEELAAKVVQLESALAEAEALAAQNKDGWLRAQANYENYRKRINVERQDWQVTANAGLLTRVFPILDDFERAFNNIPEAIADHSWLNGIKLVNQKLHHLLSIENVTVLEVSVGDLFDPMYHQAVLYQEAPGFEDGQIMSVAQKGYLLGERVLRPALVMVAKAPVEPEPEPEIESEETEASAEQE